MAACSFRPASSVPGGSGMLVFSTSRSVISVGGTTLPCPGLAVASAATTTPTRSGNGGLAVLGIAVPQAVWSLLPAGSRGIVALAVPEGVSGWGVLHSGDLPATSVDFANVEEPRQDQEALLLLQTGGTGTFRPAASSVAVPEVRRLLPEGRGVVTFTVPATTDVEDGLDKDARHKQQGLLSPTSAAGSYTIPVGTCSGVRGLLFPVGTCFGVRGEGKRGAAAFAMPKHASGWGLNGGHAKPDLLSCRCTSEGQYAKEFLVKLAEVRRQATEMHVIVGDKNTNTEVDDATRTCVGVLIDVVVAADLGFDDWKIKMEDVVGMARVFENLAAECRAGLVVDDSLKNGIRTIRQLADLVAREAVLRSSWEADELSEFAAMGKELYFKVLMDEFSDLAEAVKSTVAVKINNR